jgi:hypothetical protein
MSACVRVTDRDGLNDVMQFDHVVEILGQVHELRTPGVDPLRFAARDTTGSYPELFEEMLDSSSVTAGWKLLSGLSGQYGYSGPIMHDSEFIGGGMADHILASAPGTRWVALVNYVDTPNESCSIECDPDVGCDHDVAGWAVAYREVTA